MSQPVYRIKVSAGASLIFTSKRHYEILDLLYPFGWISQIYTNIQGENFEAIIDFLSKKSQENALMLDGYQHESFITPLTVSKYTSTPTGSCYVKFFISKKAYANHENPLSYPILAIDNFDSTPYLDYQTILKDFSSIPNIVAIGFSSQTFQPGSENSFSILLFCETTENASQLLAKSPIRLPIGKQEIQLRKYTFSNFYNPRLLPNIKNFSNIIQKPYVIQLTNEKYENDPWYQIFVSVFGPMILASLPEINNEKDANQLLMNIYDQLPSSLRAPTSS